MKPRRYTIDEVEAALIKHAGLQTEAANSLGCSRMTVARYIKRSKRLQNALVDIRERINDMAEARHIKHIEQGDGAAIRWHLARMAADRGYAEKKEVTTVVHETKKVPTFAQWADDEGIEPDESNQAAGILTASDDGSDTTEDESTP